MEQEKGIASAGKRRRRKERNGSSCFSGSLGPHHGDDARQPETLAKTGPTGAYIAEKSVSRVAMWKRRFDTEGFNPFDTLALRF